jgi:hypothetical protein
VLKVDRQTVFRRVNDKMVGHLQPKQRCALERCGFLWSDCGVTRRGRSHSYQKRPSPINQGHQTR